MTPDAKLRMDVYQEGQRAFNAETSCPYTDWRAGTWEKGRAAAEAHSRRPLDEPTPKPRAELLALAESCGAILTGKPDGSESITVVFTIDAWRAFDAALRSATQ